MSKTLERTPSRAEITDTTWPMMPRWGWRLPDFMDWPDRRSLRIEESRSDDALTIRVEIPGIDPEKDVDITVRDGVLTIIAERREHKEHAAAGGFRSEFRYGSFIRQVVLPADCAIDDIEATYESGILEVAVPMTEHTSEAQHIEVRSK